MKALQILIIIILCATPLCAEQALLLTEVEKIQENIWYLQKDLAAQKASLKEQQQQVKSIVAKNNTQLRSLDDNFTTLSASLVAQEEKTRQMESQLTAMSEAVARLTNHFDSQNSSAKEQTGEIEALRRTLQSLQAEFAQKQTASEQALAETREQLSETRTKLESLEQKVGGSVEKLGLWGAGTALLLAVILVITLVLRKKDSKASSASSRPAPRHEM